MNLTANFTLEELSLSSIAQRLEIDNTPPDSILPNLRLLSEGLEKVRALLGDHPLHIDSGYRCVLLNRAVNGAPNSAHLMGYAADFTCPQAGTPLEIVAKIKAGYFQFDQIIYEGSWVHISFDPRNRNEILTAHFGPNGTRYSAG